MARAFPRHALLGSVRGELAPYKDGPQLVSHGSCSTYRCLCCTDICVPWMLACWKSLHLRVHHSDVQSGDNQSRELRGLQLLSARWGGKRRWRAHTRRGCGNKPGGKAASIRRMMRRMRRNPRKPWSSMSREGCCMGMDESRQNFIQSVNRVEDVIHWGNCQPELFESAKGFNVPCDGNCFWKSMSVATGQHWRMLKRKAMYMMQCVGHQSSDGGEWRGR